MITSVLSIGISYYETYQMQQLRLMGTNAHVAITNPEESQIEQMKSDNLSNLISTVGISQHLGTVDTSSFNDVLLGLLWIDDTEWNTHRIPAITGITGKYPVKENEIMMPTWALSRMGITDPQIGMLIPLTYKLNNFEITKKETFVLSGYYTDYVVNRSNNKGSIYVSKAFRDSSNTPLNNGGSAMISFTNNETVQKNSKMLENIIIFTDNQSFEVVPIYHEKDTNMIFIVIMLVFFIVLSGYLLIYNVFYISISRDIRLYGQLKTLGATKKQIIKMVRLQVLKSSMIGIPTGLILGAVVSFFIVPYYVIFW